MVTDIQALAYVPGQPRVCKSPVELRSCNVELMHTSAVSSPAMLGIDLERADHGLPEDFAIVATVAARGLSQLVLRTDVAGMPLEWIDYKIGRASVRERG